MEVVDRRLNENFVLRELLQIFNDNNAGASGVYTGEVVAEKTINIYFTDDGITKECFAMPFPLMDMFGYYKLTNLGLSNCTNKPNSGTTNMRNVIQFATIHGYDYCEGTDLSQLEYKFEEGAEAILSLLAMKLFTTGNSWYSTMGFITPNIIKNKNKIEIFRNADFTQLIKSLQISQKLMTEETRQFEGYINKFVTDGILFKNDPENNKISHISNRINQYLRKVCDAQKLCNNDSIGAISSIDYFLDEYLAKLEVFCSTEKPRKNSISMYFRKMFVIINKDAEASIMDHFSGGKTKKYKTKKYKTKKYKTKKYTW